MSVKTEIRKSVGRGKFTAGALAEAKGVTVRTARANLRALEAEGIVEVVGTEKVTDDEGTALRGRPRNLFRVTSGK